MTGDCVDMNTQVEQRLGQPDRAMPVETRAES